MLRTMSLSMLRLPSASVPCTVVTRCALLVTTPLAQRRLLSEVVRASPSLAPLLNSSSNVSPKLPADAAQAAAETAATPAAWQVFVTDATALLRAFWRHTASGPNRGGNSSRKGRSSKGNGANNSDGGNGEEGTVPPFDEENNPEQWLVPRVVLFVAAVFFTTLVLYRLSLPNGKHTGWASLNRRAGEVRQIALYEHYAQVHLDKDKVYLGLISDADTQRRVEELAGNYTNAVRAAKTRAATAEKEQHVEVDNTKRSAADTKVKGGHEIANKTTATDEIAAHEKPVDLPIVMKGTPVSENALVAVGVFAWVVPFIFFPVFVMFLSQYIGKSITNVAQASKGATKAKDMIFKVETSNGTRFRDIAGMREPKREITEIVDFLRHPERYTRLGAKIPTGALLLGPPGTGKTLLAKAVAGESGVGFIPVCGSDFVELYVGMGALRVRQLFKEARKQRCIVYIDEIDAIGLKRQGSGHGEKQEQEQTLNELLTQLDGFASGRRGHVMVLASSNVSQEALDPALIRPGRFDRIIHVDAPVILERVDIFKVHLSKLRLVSTPGGLAGPREGQRGAAAAAADEAGVNADKSHVKAKNGEEKDPMETVGAVTANTPDAATTSTLTTTVAEPAANTTETRLTLFQLAEDTRLDKDIKGQETEGCNSFDFLSLLMSKSHQERALIDAYAQRMSNLCPGFVGADIANVCNEGAILAAREGAPHVDVHHLERSIDRVLAGIEHRSRVMSPFERNVVAHHEAGHAVAGWFLNRADPLMKVSIVPRGGSALGYAQYLPKENDTRTAQEIRDAIAVTLGGRIAEEIFFGHLSTGASDDLRKVGQMAYLYVSAFSPGSVYPAPGSPATRLVKPFGTTKANDLDRRAKQLVDEVHRRTHELLLRHRADMEKLAQHLLTKEMLTYQDVVGYLGERGQRAMDKRKAV